MENGLAKRPEPGNAKARALKGGISVTHLLPLLLTTLLLSISLYEGFRAIYNLSIAVRYLSNKVLNLILIYLLLGLLDYPLKLFKVKPIEVLILKLVV